MTGCRVPGRLAAMEPLTLATFTPLVGSIFRVEPDAGEPVELRLDEAEAMTSVEGQLREPFLLTFSSTGAQLPQATYPFVHETLGRVEIFVVPSEPGADATPRYQAIFN